MIKEIEKEFYDWFHYGVLSVFETGVPFWGYPYPKYQSLKIEMKGKTGKRKGKKEEIDLQLL